jgi:hypothetical protein
MKEIVMNEYEEQDKEIREARKKLKPTKVKSRHVPAWLRSRLLKLRREGKFQSDRTNNYALIFSAAEAVGCSCLLDHWGSAQRNGETVFVSEPYGAEAERVERLATFLGVNGVIESNSWHYPGYTVRVVFYPITDMTKTSKDHVRFDYRKAADMFVVTYGSKIIWVPATAKMVEFVSAIVETGEKHYPEIWGRCCELMYSETMWLDANGVRFDTKAAFVYLTSEGVEMIFTPATIDYDRGTGELILSGWVGDKVPVLVKCTHAKKTPRLYIMSYTSREIGLHRVDEVEILKDCAQIKHENPDDI